MSDKDKKKLTKPNGKEKEDVESWKTGHLQKKTWAEARASGSPDKPKTLLVDGAGFEPATSTMPTWRSCQTDLSAHSHLVSETLTTKEIL